MKCPHCGAKASQNEKFCGSCGKNINEPPAPQTPVHDGAHRSKGKAGAVALCIVLAVVAGAASGVAAYMLAGGLQENNAENVAIIPAESIAENAAEAGEKEALPEAESITEEQPAAKVYAPPVFTWAEASSMLKKSPNGNTYYPANAIDNNQSTCWASDSDLGTTPTLTIRADSKQHVSGVRFSNGYFKTEELYSQNRRITKVRVIYDGGFTDYSCPAEQYSVMQDVSFEAPADTAYVTIQVLESVAGAEGWNDICISTVEAY